MKRINLNKPKEWAQQRSFSTCVKGAIIGLAFLLLTIGAYSQNVRITGQVIDSKTSEPIPFANIIVSGTLQGTLTDLNGNYSLLLASSVNDSIRASLLGYKQFAKAIPNGNILKINFELVPHNEDLPEVVITYEGNPADAIVDSIIKYKERVTSG